MQRICDENVAKMYVICSENEDELFREALLGEFC